MAIRSVTAASAPPTRPTSGDRRTPSSSAEANPARQAEKARQKLEEPAIRAEISAMAARDLEVRSHEAAHAAAGGSLVRGGPSFETERGPDGKAYAVGGEVQIDTSAADDPRQTLAKMRQVRAAALAPANPSGQDRAVAAHASAVESRAQAELVEDVAGGEGATGADGEDAGGTRQAGASVRATSGREAPRSDVEAPQGGPMPASGAVAVVDGGATLNGDAPGQGERHEGAPHPDGHEAEAAIVAEAAAEAAEAATRAAVRADVPEVELPFPMPWEDDADVAEEPATAPLFAHPWEEPAAQAMDRPYPDPWERTAALEELLERTHLWPDPWQDRVSGAIDALTGSSMPAPLAEAGLEPSGPASWFGAARPETPLGQLVDTWV